MTKWLLILTLLTAGGCDGPYVRTDFDSSAIFSAYRTFAFTLTGDGQGGAMDNSFLRDRIERTVRQQMTTKGLTQVALEEHPDLLIRFSVDVKEKERVERTGSMVGPYAGPSAGRRYEDVTTTKYKEGTLFIDLMLPPKNDSVWRASIVGLLANAKEANTEMAENGIIKAFEDYPPKRH
jgi:hypothetical protein